MIQVCTARRIASFESARGETDVDDRIRNAAQGGAERRGATTTIRVGRTVTMLIQRSWRRLAGS